MASRHCTVDMASYASDLPSQINTCEDFPSPAPSAQSHFSQQLTEHSLNTSRSSPPMLQQSHPSATVLSNSSPCFNIQRDSPASPPQPLSVQLLPPTQPSDKPPVIPLLYTTTAALQPQATTALMPGQGQQTYMLTQSLPSTVTSLPLFGAAPTSPSNISNVCTTVEPSVTASASVPDCSNNSTNLPAGDYNI